MSAFPFTPMYDWRSAFDSEVIAAALRPPCAIHVTTEGPIGHEFAAYCARRGIPFTTCYHTNFPEYLKKYARIPQALSFAFLRRFHRRSSLLLTATPTLEAKLHNEGIHDADGSLVPRR